MSTVKVGIQTSSSELAHGDSGGVLTGSAGDLLRAEQTRPGSTYGAMIKEYITEGKIVPMEVTVKVSPAPCARRPPAI